MIKLVNWIDWTRTRLFWVHFTSKIIKLALLVWILRIYRSHRYRRQGRINGRLNITVAGFPRYVPKKNCIVIPPKIAHFIPTRWTIAIYLYKMVLFSNAQPVKTRLRYREDTSIFLSPFGQVCEAEHIHIKLKNQGGNNQAFLKGHTSLILNNRCLNSSLGRR